MKKIISVLGLILFLTPQFALADGMVVSPPDYYVYESDQRAVILYEDSTQTETMVLSVKFQGNADDFAWIVPVPNEPTITKGSDELFAALSELTQSQYYNYKYSGAELGLGAADDYRQQVTVIQTQKVDYYDIATLTSTDSQALVKWLNDNGYTYPSGSEYVFNSYINNQWYFVAVKIDASSLASSTVGKDFREGHLSPLKLVFKAKNMVYPLKISSVVTESAYNTNSNGNLNTNQIYPILDTGQESQNTGLTIEDSIYPYKPTSVDVELYILASHKKTLTDFSTTYGNWVKKSDMEKWAVDDQGDPLLAPSESKYFLTKLSRSMAYADMKEDLFPRDAKDDKKVVSGGQNNWLSLQYMLMFLLAFSIYTVFVFVIGIFSPFGLAFIIFTLVQFKTKSKAWRIFAWIVQIKVTAIYYLAADLILLAFVANPYGLAEIPRNIISGSYSGSGAFSADSLVWFFTFLTPLAIFLALPIIAMIWQVRFNKNKNNQITNK